MVEAAAARTCGTCSACCNVYPVPDLDKAEHVWCVHYREGVGCGQHAVRPQVCRDFFCLWITDRSLDDAWKPDVCGFVLSHSASGRALWVTCPADRPDAWRAEPYYSQIKAWSRRVHEKRGFVAVDAGGSMIVVFPEEDLPIESRREQTMKVGYKAFPGYRRPLVWVSDGAGGWREFMGAPFAFA